MDYCSCSERDTSHLRHDVSKKYLGLLPLCLRTEREMDDTQQRIAAYCTDFRSRFQGLGRWGRGGGAWLKTLLVSSLLKYLRLKLY
jgi:hypothetical protein